MWGNLKRYFQFGSILRKLEPNRLPLTFQSFLKSWWTWVRSIFLSMGPNWEFLLKLLTITYCNYHKPRILNKISVLKHFLYMIKLLGQGFCSLHIFGDMTKNIRSSYTQLPLLIFWEGHKILRNLHITFVLYSASQK